MFTKWENRRNKKEEQEMAPTCESKNLKKNEQETLGCEMSKNSRLGCCVTFTAAGKTCVVRRNLEPPATLDCPFSCSLAQIRKKGKRSK